MAAALNHSIIGCTRKEVSAAFLADILGLPPPEAIGRFMVVKLDNGVSLDFMEKQAPIAAQHYAFLVDDRTFDTGFARIRSAELDYWADPARTQPGRINQRHGGRGVYFLDPDGHLMEILTRADDSA